MIAAFSRKLHGRSHAMLLSVESGLPRIMLGWLVMALLASALRLATSPVGGPALEFSTILPYMLLVCAPLLSMGLALKWFADGASQPQPTIRLARVGRWHGVDRREAMRHPLYGTTGLMVSLLIGILLNVPLRALEYLTAIPAISSEVPTWLGTLHLMMTLDVVVMSSLYTVAFVAALRRVPLFPRLLVAIWLVDLALQLVIAQAVAGTEGLPPSIATVLAQLLEGNSKKVLVSMALWAPYLLLSRRVNVTFRHRVPT